LGTDAAVAAAPSRRSPALPAFVRLYESVVLAHFARKRQTAEGVSAERHLQRTLARSTLHLLTDATASHERNSQSGFSLIEAMVATTILAVALVSLADLLAYATRATMASREATRAVILAEQKMEQLKSLAWTTNDAGERVSDGGSNVAAVTVSGDCAAVATGAAVGLTPSPAGALASNTDGYVDYVDGHGCGLGGGPVPPAGSTLIRRWSIASSDADPDTLVLQVLVTRRAIRMSAPGGGASGRMPDEARVVSVKTRRVP
jgi:prepilin-type N-terminal cleavage/methylation domain-containing protein